MENSEEKTPKIFYKVEPNRKIRVFKSMFADKVFYKTLVSQKNYNGETEKYYIGLVFKKGVELDDPDGKGIDIIIKCAYENFRKNPKDEYNPIIYYMVTDFEIVERQEQVEQQAYADYRDTLEENEMEVTDDMLPF